MLSFPATDFSISIYKSFERFVAFRGEQGTALSQSDAIKAVFRVFPVFFKRDVLFSPRFVPAFINQHYCRQSYVAATFNRYAAKEPSCLPHIETNVFLVRPICFLKQQFHQY